MGEHVRSWSHGLLFEEVRSLPHQHFYRYPSRLESARDLVGIGVCLGGLALWKALAAGPGTDLVTLAGTIVTLAFAVAGTRRLWEQRAFIIDESRRRLTYVRRTPFRTCRVIHEVGELRRVLLDAPSRRRTGPGAEAEVFIQTLAGSKLYLGTAHWLLATNYSRRLAERLGLPLRHLPPGVETPDLRPS